MKNFRIFALAILVCSMMLTSWGKLKWIDSEGKFIDLVMGDRKVARYVYERMIPEDREREPTNPSTIFLTFKGKILLPKDLEVALPTTGEFIMDSPNAPLSTPTENQSAWIHGIANEVIKPTRKSFTKALRRTKRASKVKLHGELMMELSS